MLVGLVALAVGVWFQHRAYVNDRPAMLAGANATDYLLQSAVVAYRLTGDPSAGFAPRALKQVSYKPPLFAAVAGAYAALAGVSLPTFNLGATIFLLLAMLGVFVIGATLWNDAAGLIAAAVLACLPVIVQQSLTHTPEVAQLALVVWAVALMLQPGRWMPAAAGLMAGLAMLSRGTAFVYLAAPVLALLVRRRRDGAPWREIGSWLALFFGGLLLAAGPWYFTRVPQLTRDLAFHVFDFSNKYQTGYTERGRFFLAELWFGNSPVLFVTFLAGLCAGWWRRAPGFALLTAWYAAPLALFALAPADIGRFMVPTYPVMALAIAGAVVAIPWRPVAMSLAAVVLVFSFAQRQAILRTWTPATTLGAVGYQAFADPVLETEWTGLEQAVETLAHQAPFGKPEWIGILDFGEHAGPPPALLKVVWSMHQPLAGSVHLLQRIATPFDLRVFVRALRHLYHVVAIVPSGGKAWPTTEQLNELIKPRGALQENDYFRPYEPALEAMQNAGASFLEVGRVSLVQKFGPSFDLVLLAREKTEP
jgi:dolichyl-phosphate-mannose-protein mannosyltransferase